MYVPHEQRSRANNEQAICGIHVSCYKHCVGADRVWRNYVDASNMGKSFFLGVKVLLRLHF